jgi:hypothetical protein
VLDIEILLQLRVPEMLLRVEPELSTGAQTISHGDSGLLRVAPELLGVGGSWRNYLNVSGLKDLLFKVLEVLGRSLNEQEFSIWMGFKIVYPCCIVP